VAVIACVQLCYGDATRMLWGCHKNAVGMSQECCGDAQLNGSQQPSLFARYCTILCLGSVTDRTRLTS